MIWLMHICTCERAYINRQAIIMRHAEMALLTFPFGCMHFANSCAHTSCAIRVNAVATVVVIDTGSPKGDRNCAQCAA